MGKSTISMVIFNSYVKLPEGKSVVPLGLPKCPSSQQLVIPIIPGFTPPTALAFSHNLISYNAQRKGILFRQAHIVVS